MILRCRFLLCNSLPPKAVAQLDNTQVGDGELIEELRGDGGIAPPLGASGGSSDFAKGHYVFCTWPILISAYPESGPGSWSAILKHVTDSFGCYISLGGRRAVNRPNQPQGRLTIKGRHAVAAFRYMREMSCGLLAPGHLPRASGGGSLELPYQALVVVPQVILLLP